MQDLQKQIAAEEEGKEQFVFLKQRSADVGVQVVGKVIYEVPKTPLQDLGLIAYKGQAHNMN